VGVRSANCYIRVTLLYFTLINHKINPKSDLGKIDEDY